jgi:type I restriction enzyme S subunit
MFDTIKNECLGTNINNLNSSLVSGFQIVIPNKNQIEKFNKIVNSIYKKIANIQEQNQELAKLRDWLLPILMNGQVSVK